MSLDDARLDLSPAVQRMAALGLLLIVLLAIVSLIVMPLVDAFITTTDNLAQQREAIARFQQIETRLPQLEAEHAALEHNIATEAGFLQGANDALRAAEMQNRIKSIVDSHGGVLASTQILPPRDENGFHGVSAQVALLATTETLVQILYDFEHRTPYLFVDSFDIHARQIPRLDNPKITKTVLDVRLGITAYARPAAP